MIKLARPEVKIIATEPAGASLLGGKAWAPHKIQGWTPDFLPDVLNPKVFDQLLPVTDEEGKATARRLAAEEGIFVRHLGRRDRRGRAEGRGERAAAAPCCSRCCPTPASATSAAICSRT